MIGAVVRFCEGLGPPPPELDRLLKWRLWNIMPNSGGQRDQVAGELESMVIVGNYYDAWMEKTKQKKPFMSFSKEVQNLLIEMSRWVVENEPELADWRAERWAKLG